MLHEIFQAAILGITQGVGEFLPISSTAHLALVPYFFNFEDPGLAFDVSLHFGTLIAVATYFWRDWKNIFKSALKNSFILSFLSSQSSKRKIFQTKFIAQNEREKNILLIIIIATIPGVLAGYFLEEKAETIFRHPLIMATALFLAGAVLFLSDRFFKHRKNMEKLSFTDAVFIGLAQAVAIIPGVSRSGATISAGLAVGLNRVEAARFSFLMATPIIFGATLFKIDYLFYNFSAAIIIGIIFSAISGYATIKYLIKFVEKSSYAVFFWYRLVLALVIVSVYYAR